MRKKSTAIFTTKYGSINGKKPYEKRARQILPALVRQAKAEQTITYGQLSTEFGYLNARNLNFPLGTIGGSLVYLSKKWGRKVPQIQAIVVNKNTRLPGVGFSDFLKKPKSYMNSSMTQRIKIINYLLSDIYQFSKWDKVLEEFELKPMSLNPPKGKISIISKYQKGSAESREHKLLKKYIASNPIVIGLSKRFGNGKIEYPFPTMDSIDIMFQNKREIVGVEVKSKISSNDDIKRGLYQCVKYDALLNAYNKVEQNQKSVKTYLAMGKQFPSELRGLQNVLNIIVIDNILTKQ